MGLFGRRKTAPPQTESGTGTAPKSVSGQTNLHDAAARGTVADVEACLATGADVNEPNRVGYVPLSIAASRGDVDVARALLDAGADVDATDPTGTTPLAAAVLNSRGKGDMITLLLEHGADASKPNRRGQTPLELAQRITAHDVTQFFAAHN
jgi:ankyrin repeat protein